MADGGQWSQGDDDTIGVNMKPLIKKFWSEPVFFLQVPTIILATAAGIWVNEWLAFGAAITAGIGAIVARQNVTPIRSREE